MHTNENHLNPEGEERRSADLSLAREIAAGSLKAWHRFLNDYSGLIYTSLKRTLAVLDKEDAKNAYVDILASLYNGDIGKYDGKSKLSTWLFVYSRNYATDLLRKKHGRITRPSGYKQLNEKEREVLQLFFVEMLPMDVVIHIMNCSGFSISASGFIQAVRRIEDLISENFLRKMRSEYSSRIRGIPSSRLFRLLNQLKIDYRERAARNEPDRYLDKEEQMARIKALHRAIENLTRREKDIINLRFFQGLTAGECAARLGIANKRDIYYATEKIIKKLRKLLK